MSYYYQSHIRNLEEQAQLQKRKIAAELYQKELLESINNQSRSQQNGLKKSRRQEDLETAAFLERSRLSAQLSAMRIKAENSMNRSRLQAAFQLRKENQKALGELERMNHRHVVLQQHALRQTQLAALSYEASRRLAQQLYDQQKMLQNVATIEEQRIKQQLNIAQRLTGAIKQRYYPY